MAAVAELAAAYLIIGTDRPKISRAVRRLRTRVGEDATEIRSAQEASGEDVVAACNALGLFAVERRLVVVEDVESWKAADLKALGEYLVRPAPTTVLVLVGSEVKKDSPLAKAVAKSGEILLYDLPKRGRKADLPRWVEAQLRERGVLVEQVGGFFDVSLFDCGAKAVCEHQRANPNVALRSERVLLEDLD